MPPSDAVERHFRAAREQRWFSNGGPCWGQLRSALEERTGVFCIPVANATLGLVAAIAAVRTDRTSAARTVVLPSFTFAAAVHAVRICGLAPAFIDIDREHWHVDPSVLERVLSRDDIALVLACSSFGTPPPPEVRRSWEGACAERGIPLVIDSAAGFGASGSDGVPIGAQGTAEIVSFHATKPFAIGEGGAVFTHDESLAKRVERIVNFGFDTKRRVAEPLALNGKMSEVHAAIGLAVLDDFEGILRSRRDAAEALRAELSSRFGFQAGSERSTWQFVPVATRDAEQRNALLTTARTLIELRTYYEPLHLMPAFADVPVLGALEATEALGDRIISLPMANDLSSTDISTIVRAVSRA